MQLAGRVVSAGMCGDAYGSARRVTRKRRRAEGRAVLGCGHHGLREEPREAAGGLELPACRIRRHRGEQEHDEQSVLLAVGELLGELMLVRARSAVVLCPWKWTKQGNALVLGNSTRKSDSTNTARSIESLSPESETAPSAAGEGNIMPIASLTASTVTVVRAHHHVTARREAAACP